MSVLQRFVTDPETAARMFPTHEPISARLPTGRTTPPTVSFLVGPINCETCDGTGEHFIDLMTQIPGPCDDCDGNGYPARIEIVSLCDEPTCPGSVTGCIMHGVVALGKPIPVSEMPFPMLIGEHVTVLTYGATTEVNLWTNQNGSPMVVDTPSGLQFTDPVEITDRLSGPVKPGDVVHILSEETA